MYDKFKNLRKVIKNRYRPMGFNTGMTAFPINRNNLQIASFG